MVAVDANVFLHGRANYDFESMFTVPEVVEEVKSERGKTVLQKVDYSVRSPGQETVKEVSEKADEINSPTSEADEKLLALALERKEEVVTDDKPLQNLALHLDIDFSGYMDDATTKMFRWEEVCGNCGAELSGRSCSRCGSTQVRRKRVRHS